MTGTVRVGVRTWTHCSRQDKVRPGDDSVFTSAMREWVSVICNIFFQPSNFITVAMNELLCHLVLTRRQSLSARISVCDVAFLNTRETVLPFHFSPLFSVHRPSPCQPLPAILF